MTEPTRSFTDLIAWQKAMDLAPMAYQLVRTLPKHDEGQARQHPNEFQQHLAMARGSLAELDTLLLVGQRLNYWEEAELQKAMNPIIEVRRIIQGLLNSLKRSRLRTPVFRLPSPDKRCWQEYS